MTERQAKQQAKQQITVEAVLQQYGKIIWSTLLLAIGATGWTLHQLHEIDSETQRLRFGQEQMRNAIQVLDRDGTRGLQDHLEISAERYRRTTESLARIEERLGIKEREQ